MSNETQYKQKTGKISMQIAEAFVTANNGQREVGQTQVTNVRVGVNLYKGKDKIVTRYFDVSFWGNVSKRALALQPGAHIVLYASDVDAQAWLTNDTKEARATLKVIGDDFLFIGSAPSGQSKPAAAAAESTPAPAQEEAPPTNPEDEDIPF